MKKDRVRLITTVLLIQLITACSASQVSETEEAVKVAIVTVNESEQYVEIRNNEDAVRELNGWYLSLGRRLTCYLNNGVHIQPGETLRIWALSKDAGEGGLNCGLDHPFWDSKEPKRMFLYNGDRQVMDSYFGGEG